MKHFLAVGMFAFLAGCGGAGDSSTNPTPANMSGTYTVKTIAGKTLPLVTGEYTVLTYVLTIAGSGTWSESESTRPNSGGQTTTYNGGGIWSLTGKTRQVASGAFEQIVQLDCNGGAGCSGHSGTWDGKNTLTLNISGLGEGVFVK